MVKGIGVQVDMTEFKTLRLDQNGGVALVTLNVPEKRNAMTEEMTKEFPELMGALRQNDGVRAVVLTGAGSAFCAGGELGLLEAHLEWGDEENRRFMGEFYRAYLTVLSLDVPVIAAINGPAVGAGLSLALSCDIRFAAEGAKLGATFLNVGLHPGMGTTYLLPHTVGYASAADLIFTGRTVTAWEALDMKLVSRVIPPDELIPLALAVAHEIAAKPITAVRMAKRALARGKLAGLEAVLDYEAAAQMSNFGSSEMRHAIARVRQGLVTIATNDT